MSDIFGRNINNRENDVEIAKDFIMNPKGIVIESPAGTSDSTIIRTEDGVVLPFVVNATININAEDLANTATLTFIMPRGSITVPADNIKIVIQEYENHSLPAPPQEVDSD